MTDAEENQVYKRVIKKTLMGNRDFFCPFRKEKQMDYLFSALKPVFKIKNQQVLEAGCGYGRLIYFLNEFDPNQKYTGIDYVRELVAQGKQIFRGKKNIKFFYANMFKMPGRFEKYFDISVSYKTLSWLPGYEEIIKQLVKVTKKKIYITSLFYDGDIDFVTKIYSNARNNRSDFTFLNTYSFPKFKKYCRLLGVKEIKATDMYIDVDLPRPKDMSVLKTYTSRLRAGGKLEITGVTILHWKLIELTL